MGKRLLTAVNIGLILGLVIVLAREPGGGLLAAVFVLLVVVCLGFWLYFHRRDDTG